MLNSGDGRCGAWADLFRQMIKVQGIDMHDGIGLKPNDPPYVDEPSTRTITPPEQQAILGEIDIEYPGNVGREIPYNVFHFLVKNWGDLSVGDFIELPSVMGLPFTAENYSIAQSDLGLSGIAGQGPGAGVPDPRSIFPNHAIVAYNSKLYDPSYGVKYNSSSSVGYIEFENESLDAALGTIVRVQLTATDAKWFYYVSTLNNDVTLQLENFTTPY